MGAKCKPLERTSRASRASFELLPTVLLTQHWWAPKGSSLQSSISPDATGMSIRGSVNYATGIM